MSQSDIIKILSYDKYIDANEIYKSLCKKEEISRSSMSTSLLTMLHHNEVIRRRTNNSRVLYEYKKSRIYN